MHNLEPQLEGKTTLKLCKSMDQYLAIPLIDAINKERRKVGKHDIPASDDMCATALFKGLVQMVRFLYCAAKFYCELEVLRSSLSLYVDINFSDKKTL